LKFNDGEKKRKQSSQTRCRG